MNKVIETVEKSALTAAGTSIGGGIGAALGTAIFPGNSRRLFIWCWL